MADSEPSLVDSRRELTLVDVGPASLPFHPKLVASGANAAETMPNYFGRKVGPNLADSGANLANMCRCRLRRAWPVSPEVAPRLGIATLPNGSAKLGAEMLGPMLETPACMLAQVSNLGGWPDVETPACILQTAFRSAR